MSENQQDVDLVHRLLSQLNSPRREVAEPPTLAARQTADADNRIKRAESEDLPAPMRMDRRFQSGPSPARDTPQARFKEVVLGIRGEGPKNQKLPVYRPLANGFPPMHSGQQPPLPKPAMASNMYSPQAQAPRALLDSPFYGSQGTSLDYGRLSPPHFTEVDVHASTRVLGANHPMATRDGAYPVSMYPNPPVEMMPRYPGGSYPVSSVGFATGGAPGREHDRGYPSSMDFRAVPMSSLMPNTTHDVSWPSNGQAPAPPKAQAASNTSHSPTYAQLLSLECQLRRFNPEWEEREVVPKGFICAVKLRKITLRNNTMYPSSQQAKQAMARKALRVVREWPVGSVVPPAIQKAIQLVNTGQPAYNRGRPEHRVDGVAPSRSPIRVKRESSVGPTHGLESLVDMIEHAIGDQIPPDIKTNPAVARAYFAGFSVGSRCAEMAARGDGVSESRHQTGRGASSWEPTHDRGRSRSRSPRDSRAVRSSPPVDYRRRSPPRSRAGQDRWDRYRPSW